MKKVLLGGIAAGIAILVVTLIVNNLVQLVWPYDVLTMGGMRSATDPIMALFFLYPFVLGIAMAFVYQYMNLKGSTLMKGKKFGLMMWAVYGLPSIWIVYTSMSYPAGFYASNLIGNLIALPAAGIVIAKISK